MRYADAIFPGGGTLNPDYDVAVPELRIQYRVGSDENPDEVLLLKVANGHFVVDDEFRAQIRGLLLAPEAEGAHVDVQVREAHVALMGPIWYDIVLLLGGAAISPIVSPTVEAGLSKLKQKLAPMIRTPFNTNEFDANERAQQTPAMKQQVINLAKADIVASFDVELESLTMLSINLTDFRSASFVAATTVFRAADGATFTVSSQYDGAWRVVGITRS